MVTEDEAAVVAEAAVVMASSKLLKKLRVNACFNFSCLTSCLRPLHTRAEGHQLGRCVDLPPDRRPHIGGEGQRLGQRMVLEPPDRPPHTEAKGH